MPDTRLDPRFADNPLVTGPPYIRFCAGAPMFTTEGYGLGTLCVIDTKPRQLNAMQKRALQLMRDHVLKLFDLQSKTQDLVALNRELDAFSHAVSHDLRAPLRAVAGYSHLLRAEHGDRLDADGRALIAHVERAAKRMDQLIDDLLHLSQAVRAPISRATVDLS